MSSSPSNRFLSYIPRLIAFLLLALTTYSLPLIGQTSTPIVVYVDSSNQNPSQNGRSWKQAYTTLQRAIDQAALEGGGEVWVAQGTYYPTAKSDRKASFQLEKKVQVYGGFKGTETNLHQRDWKKNITILSGDIGRKGVDSDNSYHVVTGADQAVLDGFTITKGYSVNSHSPKNSQWRRQEGRPSNYHRPPSHPQGRSSSRERRGRESNRYGPPQRGSESRPGSRGREQGHYPPPHPPHHRRSRENGQDRGHHPPPHRRDRQSRGNRREDQRHQGHPPRRENRESNRPPRRDGQRPSERRGNRGSQGHPPRGQDRSGFGRSGPRPIHTSPERILQGLPKGTGAGMANFQCAPTIRNCRFVANKAMKGGAVYNMVSRTFPPSKKSKEKSPTFLNCEFIDNYARMRGGAVSNDLGTHPTFRHCIFSGNKTDEKGGAVYNDFNCSPTITHCLFVNNQAFRAGAMGNDGGSSPFISHCTFTGNKAEDMGAAIYQGTGPANNPVIQYCIFWENICQNGPAEIANWHDNSPKVTNSCIQGGFPGTNNLNQDPRFTATNKGNYQLQSNSPCPQAGHLAATNTTPQPPTGYISLLPRKISKPNLYPPTYLPSQKVVYVNQNNPAKKTDGKSWATAYRDLQVAIDHAWKSRGEVWVAAGKYIPQGKGRQATFQMRLDVAVYGGFSGIESKLEERNQKQNPTILSGDIGRKGEVRDNSYHVIIGCDGAVLDGFIVTGGYANGLAYDGKGGGMVNYFRSPQGPPRHQAVGYSTTVRNCVFKNNYAQEGGAIYNYDRSTPLLTNCTFQNNNALYGGAIVDRVGVKSVLKNCRFEGNQARWRGGALYLDYGSRPTLVDCQFINNTSRCHGGGVYTSSRASQLENTVAKFTHCTFQGNRAVKRGGAIANDDKSMLLAESCTFTKNRALEGGGAISNDRGGQLMMGRCDFKNNQSAKGKANIDSFKGKRKK